MLPSAAVMSELASRNRVSFTSSPYDWVPVAVIILLIVLIFVRVYGRGGRSGGGAAHKDGRRTVHRASRVPERGENHGHRAVSKRRPNRP